MKELVSIIIPVYNSEKYLRDCLESIVNQTYKNIEIILINDGSKDNSIKIINEYKEKDSRIIVIDRENKGVLNTRIEGFKKANGKYITYVDSDDWIEKDAIEILYNKILEHSSDVVKCEFAYNDSKIANGNLNTKNDKFIKKDEFEPSFYDMYLVNMNIHTVWAQMFKKELLYKYIEDIDTSIAMGDDLEINIQLYKNIDSILFIPNTLYHYRYNNNSITNSVKVDNIKKNIIDITKSYYHLYTNIENYNIKDKMKYKQAVMAKIIDEVCNHQINLIGATKNRKKSIEYLKWYYNEYDVMQTIRNEIKSINFEIDSLAYKIFYKKIYKNINLAYLIGKIIWLRRTLKNNIKFLMK